MIDVILDIVLILDRDPLKKLRSVFIILKYYLYTA